MDWELVSLVFLVISLIACLVALHFNLKAGRHLKRAHEALAEARAALKDTE